MYITLQDVHYMAKDLGEDKLADSAKESAKKAAGDFVSGVFHMCILHVRTFICIFKVSVGDGIREEQISGRVQPSLSQINDHSMMTITSMTAHVVIIIFRNIASFGLGAKGLLKASCYYVDSLKYHTFCYLQHVLPLRI